MGNTGSKTNASGEVVIPTPDFHGEDAEMLQRLYRERQSRLLKRVFSAYDTDGNGFITFRELKESSADMGEPMSDEKVQEAITVMDKDLVRWGRGGEGVMFCDFICGISLFIHVCDVSSIIH